MLQAVRVTRLPVPGPVVVVVLAVLLSALLDFRGHGIAVVGDIPSSLPRARAARPRAAPPLDQLLIGAAAIFLVSFAAGIVTARSFGERGGYPVDADREMVGFGAANLAAGLFGAFPITASDSRTAINASVGGRSQLASVVAAATLVAIVLYLQPALAILPIPALGAILIAAALSLDRRSGAPRDLADQPHGVRLRDDRALRADQPRGAERRAHRHRRDLRLPPAQDDVPARRAARPRPRPRRLLQAAPPPGRAARSPASTIALIQGDLLFFNADHVHARLHAIADAMPAGTRWLLLDASAIAQVDSTAAAMLEEVRADLAARGIGLRPRRAARRGARPARPGRAARRDRPRR